jgi:transcription elongation factor Elf1
MERDVSCPFCGEAITLLVDASAGAQSYIEDCQVCCQPMQVTVEADDGEIESLKVVCAS